jgi:hypothetical protein
MRTSTQDKIIEFQANLRLERYYVSVRKGENKYFTRYCDAEKFADSIGSEVKPLD